MLKLKEGYILRKIAGENVVIASGEELDLNMMISLNETGTFLWKLLEKGSSEEEMVGEILKEYDTDEATAAAAVHRFVVKLQENELLA